MATSTTEAELECGFSPFRMTTERYERLCSSGVYAKNYPFLFWKGRLFERIREGFPPTPDGAFPEHRMTVERYLQLVEAGIFTEDDPVFLWDGSLVEKMTKGRSHSFSALKLEQLLIRILPDAFHVELEQPMILDDQSVPEPDLMILRGALEEYGQRMPTAVDVALIVEVADSSVTQDTVIKSKAYAAQAIPIYWIVNLRDRWIEVHGQPTGPVENPCYQKRHQYGADDEVPVILDGREIARFSVRQILG